MSKAEKKSEIRKGRQRQKTQSSSESYFQIPNEITLANLKRFSILKEYQNIKGLRV